MATSKVSIKAKPTFWAPVEIPVPGEAKPMVIKLQFKHRTREEFEAFLKEVRDRAEAVLAAQTPPGPGEAPKEAPEEISGEEQVMRMACGWDGVEEEWNAENIAEFLSNYHAAAQAIGFTYASQLTQARSGN